jgi:hypothetical protein
MGTGLLRHTYALLMEDETSWRALQHVLCRYYIYPAVIRIAVPPVRLLVKRDGGDRANDRRLARHQARLAELKITNGLMSLKHLVRLQAASFK